MNTEPPPRDDNSAATLTIAQEPGLLCDSSLFSDDAPDEHVCEGKPTSLVELPVEWIRDDTAWFLTNRHGAQRPYTPPADVRESESARAEGGRFLLTMQPHVIGYRSRIFILAELLSCVAAVGDFWIASPPMSTFPAAVSHRPG